MRKLFVKTIFDILMMLVKDKYKLPGMAEDYVYGDGYTEYFRAKFDELSTTKDPQSVTMDRFDDTPNACKLRACVIRKKTIGR